MRRLQLYSEAIGLKLNAAIKKVLRVGYESDPETNLTLNGKIMNVCEI